MLREGRSGDQSLIPVRGRDFSRLRNFKTGCGYNQRVTSGSIPSSKWPERKADSLATDTEAKNSGKIYSHYPIGLHIVVRN
jgi:hypothetical protein